MTNSTSYTSVDIAKALGDDTRLRLLLACEGREVCVCQLQALVGLAMSTVSQHLAQLRRVGLLEGRKQGRWMYYRMADPESAEIHPSVCAGLELALSGAFGIAQYGRDREWLGEILAVDPEALCRLLKDEGCCTPEFLRRLETVGNDTCC